MISIGSRNIKLVNPSQIVSVWLSKGKVTAFVKGTSNAEGIKVSDLDIRAPWTVVIRTIITTHYINCKDFEEALDKMIVVSAMVHPIKEDIAEFKRRVRESYGQ